MDELEKGSESSGSMWMRVDDEGRWSNGDGGSGVESRVWQESDREVE